MFSFVRNNRIFGIICVGLGLMPVLAGCHAGASGDNPPTASQPGKTAAAGPGAQGRTPAEMFSHMKKPHP